MKRALITGAGRGIGLATARRFAAAGWRVLSLDKEFGSDVVGERVAFDLAGTSRIAALPLSDLVGSARVSGWSIPSCVLDAGMYACAMHLWWFSGNAIALPRRIADLRLHRQPRDGETCHVNFICLDFAAGDYDFDVVGEDGSLIVQARGYGHVIFARGEFV